MGSVYRTRSTLGIDSGVCFADTLLTLPLWASLDAATGGHPGPASEPSCIYCTYLVFICPKTVPRALGVRATHERVVCFGRGGVIPSVTQSVELLLWAAMAVIGGIAGG